MKHVRDVSHLFRLVFDCAPHPRMPVAKTGDGQPAEKVQIAVAVGVVQIGAMAAYERKRRAAIGVGETGVRKFDDFAIVHRPPDSGFSGKASSVFEWQVRSAKGHRLATPS